MIDHKSIISTSKNEQTDNSIIDKRGSITCLELYPQWTK